MTGASAGIGRLIASHLAQGGYRVAAVARSLDKLEALGGDGVLAVNHDVTDLQSVTAAGDQNDVHSPILPGTTDIHRASGST